MNQLNEILGLNSVNYLVINQLILFYKFFKTFLLEVHLMNKLKINIFLLVARVHCKDEVMETILKS